MPRNMKCRKICAEFQHKVFTPEEKEQGYIIICMEELEAMRLCDLENLDQEEAAKKMDVSRGTFQRILYSARHKSTKALCEGKGILIQGGKYEISDKCPCDSKCSRCTKL